jgi:hypothetical protein
MPDSSQKEAETTWTEQDERPNACLDEHMLAYYAKDVTGFAGDLAREILRLRAELATQSEFQAAKRSEDPDVDEESLADAVALQVLCRVFDDIENAMDEWRAYYKPGEWLWFARGLGAFVRTRLEATRSPSGTGSATDEARSRGIRRCPAPQRSKKQERRNEHRRA